MKFKIAHLIVGLVISITGFAILVLRNLRAIELLDTEYPEIQTKDSIISIVKTCTVTRGVARILDSNERKFRLPWAGNQNYVIDNLCNAASPGDTIQKQAFSDSIVVKKKGQKLLFISRKIIPKQ